MFAKCYPLKIKIRLFESVLFEEIDCDFEQCWNLCWVEIKFVIHDQSKSSLQHGHVSNPSGALRLPEAHDADAGTWLCAAPQRSNIRALLLSLDELQPDQQQANVDSSQTSGDVSPWPGHPSKLHLPVTRSPHKRAQSSRSSGTHHRRNSIH